jgi:Co/Zn/Cd efflux system component
MEGITSEQSDHGAEERAQRQVALIPQPHQSKKNQDVLLLTSILFFLFVVAEFVGAVEGNSLSLLGDAVAMSIDVFTVS